MSESVETKTGNINSKKYKPSAIAIILYVLSALMLIYACYQAGSIINQINEYYDSIGEKATTQEYVTYVLQAALEPVFRAVILFAAAYITSQVRKLNPDNYEEKNIAISTEVTVAEDFNKSLAAEMISEPKAASANRSAGGNSARNGSNRNAKAGNKATSNGSAKPAAKNGAKSSGSAAKNESKSSAKSTAKSTAKSSGKGGAKSSNGSSKSTAKTGTRNASKSAARSSAKPAGRKSTKTDVNAEAKTEIKEAVKESANNAAETANADTNE